MGWSNIASKGVFPLTDDASCSATPAKPPCYGPPFSSRLLPPSLEAGGQIADRRPATTRQTHAPHLSLDHSEKSWQRQGGGTLGLSPLKCLRPMFR